MNIAITVWGNRISPVFDAAKTLLVVEIIDGEVVGRTVRTFQATRFDWFEKIFQEMEVQLLICGAICEVGVNRFEAMGIEVVPFLTGEVEKLLEQFVRGKEFSDFTMPGCRVGPCCKRSGVVLGHPVQVLKAGCKE
ncbi:MAG: dinitrogenase iron-molybdenum cofactor biosynthesis domain-containing protein [Desulfobulbaceae bacterium]|nr:dinitrogenase iron-molybdenum cofactor biosynthesis domain-containing protein [Desulfobulbaceae bacterium]